MWSLFHVDDNALPENHSNTASVNDSPFIERFVQASPIDDSTFIDNSAKMDELPQQKMEQSPCLY